MGGEAGQRSNRSSEGRGAVREEDKVCMQEGMRKEMKRSNEVFTCRVCPWVQEQEQ